MLTHPDAHTVLRSVLKSRLPLSEAVLSMAVEHLHDPARAALSRLARLLPPQQLHLKGVHLSIDLQQVWVVLTFRVSSMPLSECFCELCILGASARLLSTWQLHLKGMQLSKVLQQSCMSLCFSTLHSKRTFSGSSVGMTCVSKA